MAKTRSQGSGEPTKATAIRKLLDSNPRMKTAEVVDALKSKGVKVTGNQVYLVKSKARGRKVRARRDRVQALMTGQSGTNLDAIVIVTRAKDLARDMGGMKKLKALVDLLVQ